jgi:hypothetical protein
MTVRPMIFAALVAGSLGSAREVRAGGSPVIHVRGAARVNAAASSLESSAVVTGTVIDDTGRPVGGASLRVRALGADGSAVPLEQPGPCPNAASTSSPPLPGVRAEQGVTADSAGRFCATFATDRAALFVVAFSDPRGLFDASEVRATVDHTRRAVELRFAPTTTTFELERDAQRLQVSTHVVAPAPSAGPLPLAVYALGPSGETLVSQGACPVDGATELELQSNKLAGPGPVELVLRFAGTAALQPAEARRRVLATARVSLALSRAPAPADPADGVTLDVALGSAAGAVEGGSVEARLGAQTVGIARVEHGAARLVAQFPRRGDSARLELRYLSLEPWWRPGDTLVAEVKLLSRARWVSLGWLSALAAIALWLLWGWRRPERSANARTAFEQRAPAAGIHLVKRADDEPGWRGVVRDAHDGRPIPGAVVALVSRVPERVLHARVSADQEGRFELVGATPGELELAVSAPWHSDFSCRAPPHGELRVELVSRRRYLVGRLVRWAERRGPLGRTRGEPTPGDVKKHGRRARRDEVVAWASAVEAAAFGHGPVDETVERDVTRQEPPEQAGAGPRAVKRAH